MEKLINEIIKEIKLQQEKIKKMNEIDSKYYDMKINTESIIEILKQFKNYKDTVIKYYNR